VIDHTIGEVLNRLKDEFDDITISKIRFLEAEGLISPDRTESGYRRFTEDDIDRLRYVLRAQRDRYLPLKVIKDELARIDAGLPPQSAGDAVADPVTPPPRSSPGGGLPLELEPTQTLFDPIAPEVRFNARELADASGQTDDEIDSLRDHGVLGPGPHYDTDDLRITKLATALLAGGLEPRHLRMYRQFADREAALVEQLITPLLRQRNPDSRRTATQRAEHLTEVGGELHRALLTKLLRALLRS
jgi:DNA-binding transcriptional MerR regulator